MQVSAQYEAPINPELPWVELSNDPGQNMIIYGLLHLRGSDKRGFIDRFAIQHNGIVTEYTGGTVLLDIFLTVYMGDAE